MDPVTFSLHLLVASMLHQQQHAEKKEEKARRSAPLPPAGAWTGGGQAVRAVATGCALGDSSATCTSPLHPLPVAAHLGHADRTGMEELDMDVEKAARPEFVHPYCCDDRDSHPCVGTSKRSTPSNLTPRFRIYSKVNGAGNSRTMAIQDSWLSNYPETLRRAFS